MTPSEFVNALIEGGGTNIADENDDADYCSVHGYDHSYAGNLYHEDECEAYAAKLKR